MIGKSSESLDLAELARFFVLWILISGLLFAGSYWTGLMPGYMRDFVSGVLASSFGSGKINPEFSKDDVILIIPKINLVVPVVFPTSTDLAILKNSLYRGVVHYPESAMPSENGNTFIFGHSSNKPFEKNPARTAFTKLNQLENGDEIFIQSGKIKYAYRVVSREIVDPEETRVYLNSDKPKLTLSTCWPVGDPLKRTMIEAEFLAGETNYGSWEKPTMEVELP